MSDSDIAGLNRPGTWPRKLRLGLEAAEERGLTACSFVKRPLIALTTPLRGLIAKEKVEPPRPEGRGGDTIQLADPTSTSLRGLYASAARCGLIFLTLACVAAW